MLILRYTGILRRTWWVECKFMAKQCMGKHIVQKRKCTQRKTIFIFQKLSPNLSKIVKGQKRSLELESSALHKCKSLGLNKQRSLLPVKDVFYPTSKSLRSYLTSESEDKVKRNNTYENLRTLPSCLLLMTPSSSVSNLRFTGS